MAKLFISEIAEKVAEKAIHEVKYEGKTIREWIELILSDNIAEVVRCKDCSHCRETIDRFGAGLFCSRWNRDWQRVQPDDFCSYGERREGE